MIVIGVISIVLMFCILCGIAATTKLQETIIKNQIETIRVLKNK